VGTGVFEIADCKKTYDELSAKGVGFDGIEALFKDNSGNLVQPDPIERNTSWQKPKVTFQPVFIP